MSHPTQPQESYGQQPPHGFQPPMTPQQAKAQAKAAKAHAKALRPFWKKKRVILPALLVAVIAISVALNGGGGSDPTAGTEAAVAGKEAGGETKIAKIGDSVSAGDFTFTVTGFECGLDFVGDKDFGEKAQGHYCLLDLSAQNTGKEAVTLLGFDQKVLDAEGREFSTDDMAAIYVSEGNPLAEEINPGNTVEGTLVFDVPADVTPETAVLSGGLFDDPVNVSLK